MAGIMTSDPPSQVHAVATKLLLGRGTGIIAVVSEVLNSWKWTTKILPYHVSIIISIIAHSVPFHYQPRLANTPNLPLLLARRISTATQALVRIYTTDRLVMWRWRGDRTAGVLSEAMCRSTCAVNCTNNRSRRAVNVYGRGVPRACVKVNHSLFYISKGD